MNFLEAIDYINTNGGAIHNPRINEDSGGTVIRVRKDDPENYVIMTTHSDGPSDTCGWREEDPYYHHGAYATKLKPSDLASQDWMPYVPDPEDHWWELESYVAVNPLQVWL